MRLGIIDVGTNSIHLVIVELGPRRQARTLIHECALARLGEDGLARNRLRPVAMQRALSVLRRYAALLTRYEAQRVEAVATSAVRDAVNGRPFVRRVRQLTGLPLRIISGREEGRLLYQGLAQTRRLRGPTVVLALGGGSAQVMRGDGSRLQRVTSLPLGCARLAQRFIHHDPPQPPELERLRRHAWRAWAPVAQRFHISSREAVGSSSMIGQLLAAARATPARGAPPRQGGVAPLLTPVGRNPERAHPAKAGWRESKGRTQSLTVSQETLRAFLQWLARSRASARRRLPGVDPRREEWLLPAGMTLLTWMERCGIRQVSYAPGSLRDGIVVDYTGA